MHSMDWKPIGEGIVVEGHIRSSSLVTDLQRWLFSCSNAGLLIGDSKSVFTIYTIRVTSRPLCSVRVYSLLIGLQYSFVVHNRYNYMMSDFSTDPAFPTGNATCLSNMEQRGNGWACQKPSFPHHYSLITLYLHFIKSCKTLTTFTFPSIFLGSTPTNKQMHA